MKVFLSWSGETSKQIAQRFKEWLPLVIQQVEPYMSSEMEKGVRWSEDIHKELQGSAFGLIFLTPDNIEKPWICYEAGALANKLDSINVSPFYFNISPSDIQNSPLTLFQATKNDKDDILKLIKSLNSKLPDEKKMDDIRLEKTFEQWWPNIEKDIQGIPSRHKNDSKENTFNPIEEVVENTRNIMREIHSLKALQVPQQKTLGQALTTTVKDLRYSEIRYRKGYVHGAMSAIMALEEHISKKNKDVAYNWVTVELEHWLWRAVNSTNCEIELPPEM